MSEAAPAPLDLRTVLGPLELRSPVVTASGTFGYGIEYDGLVDFSRLGAVVVKGLTLEPREGSPPPRICETPSGMLNSIGLENPGVEVFIAEKLPWLVERDVPVIANLNGGTVEEYAQLARRLGDAPGVVAVEANISCPNVDHGGMEFGKDPAQTARVVGAVREATELPLIVKLSPNVTDIVAIARAAVESGANVLSLINTLLGMSIDIFSRRPRLARGKGGLSGPAIKPVAIRMVWEVRRALPEVPLIGMGGILTGADAVEFMLAGASAVAVGTGSFVTPSAANQVLDGLIEYGRHLKLRSLAELVGGVIL
ncbi:MAG: dihydroorotate dehydrogenase [Armatimonadetes bacterium]|nr:dihydroorotate dehydrogenase [Armatimonadota bacterium]